MTEAIPSVLGLPSVRTLEWLAGTDLLAVPAATSTSQLSGLGPVASLVETAIVGDPVADESGPLPDVVAATANTLVLDTHAQLEQTGHEVPALNGPLHGLTNLGETLGLGHLNASGNLVTDAFALALGGDATSIPTVLTDAGNVANATGTLIESASGIVGSATGTNPLGNGGLLASVAAPLNQGVLELHAQLEQVGHQNPSLNGPIHGLTNLGESLGLGHLGTPGNLLTDVTALPGAVLAGGGLGAVSPLLHDLGDVTDAAGNLVNQVLSPAASGGPLSSTGLLGPVSSVANGAVLDLHATLEQIGHDVPVLNGVVHGVTELGETVGLGHLGEPGNLLTDVVNLPGSLLGGEGTAALTPVLSDVGDILGAVGNLTGAVTGTLGTGGGGLLQPVVDILDGASGGSGVGGLLQPATDLLADVTGGGDSGGLLQPVTAILDNVAGGEANGGLLQPVTAILDGNAGESGIGGILQPVADVVGGATGNGAGGLPSQLVDTVRDVLGSGGSEGGTGGGLLGGLLGGLSGTGAGGTGPAPLIDLGIGPQTDHPALDANLLSSGTGSDQAIQVSALDSGSQTPALGVSLLSGDGIAFPGSSGGGIDSLVGRVLDLTPASSPTSAQAEPGVHLDLGMATLDLGGHVDTHATDTQHHAPSLGLHLLGL
ncbi:hypothetical protein [Methylobacterium sp. B4]|uniref:hypothetical protein n=1 Tax=Methylobacterium sp. B4 TaxID=1938755 RepID=UPI000D766FB8|nr:hypothetical protein [Methylobacterium sp. B4]PXW62124.1 hypothetical protein BY998_107111 [Methylobacterium sp. B4]